MGFETQRNEYNLTPRQWEFLGLVARGYTRVEIAEQCGVTLDTVKAILKNAFHELDLRSNVDACLWWVNNVGIPEPRQELPLVG